VPENALGQGFANPGKKNVLRPIATVSVFSDFFLTNGKTSIAIGGKSVSFSRKTDLKKNISFRSTGNAKSDRPKN
jgi:hypothetical protein